MVKIGFIDYFLDEWHANNYPKWFREATNGEVQVTLAYGLIDSPKGGRTTEKWCADMGIARAESIEQVIAESDGIVVLSPDNCEMHEKLSDLPLRSGKRLYIDKTFAPDYAAAKRMFDLAEKYATPMYTTSSLRYASEYTDLAGKVQVNSIASVGPNGFDTYSIHQLEPVMMLIPEMPRKVKYDPSENRYTLTIAFDGGKTATVTGVLDDYVPFEMDMDTDSGKLHTKVTSDFWGVFTKEITGFFKGGTGIVPCEETLRIMLVRTAGLKAMQQPGTWIDIES